MNTALRLHPYTMLFALPPRTTPNNEQSRAPIRRHTMTLSLSPLHRPLVAPIRPSFCVLVPVTRYRRGNYPLPYTHPSLVGSLSRAVPAKNNTPIPPLSPDKITGTAPTTTTTTANNVIINTHNIHRKLHYLCCLRRYRQSLKSPSLESTECQLVHYASSPCATGGVSGDTELR